MSKGKRIYIKIGESFHRTEIENESSSKRRQEHECTGGLKQLYADSDGSSVCLKEYNVNEIHPFDLKVIKRHVERKTADGTPFYDFTRDSTLNEIRAEKTMFLSKKQRKHHYVDAENSVFSSATFTLHVPEKIIPEHDETKSMYWNCDDDIWGEEE
jgi:hypothetical protein